MDKNKGETGLKNEFIRVNNEVNWTVEICFLRLFYDGVYWRLFSTGQQLTIGFSFHLFTNNSRLLSGSVGY